MKASPAERNNSKERNVDQVYRMGWVGMQREVVRLCLAVILLLVTSQGAIGQQVSVSANGDASNQLDVYVGQSKALSTDWPVNRVSVTDPQIADVEVLSPNQVLVLGKEVGSTDLLLWRDDQVAWQARVQVRRDLRALQDDLGNMFPGSDLELRQVGDSVVISGQLSRVEQAAQLHNFFEGAEIKYVDLTYVAGVQQVMLQVRIAEASRTAIRQLGVNFFGTGSDFFGGNTIGPSGGGPINPVNIGVPEGASAAGGPDLPFAFLDDLNISPGVTLFAGVPDADLQVFVQALAENQYLRILAEPNLVALSGERASFLAGGEYPIPVVQGGTSESTTVTIEYREFGVRLNFLPVVLGDGSIHLYVAPEVSELTDVGAVVIQGFQIPALRVRRTESTVQLKSGQTFAMAGLLNQKVDARNSRIPGLGSLPVLGPLFRSVRYQQDETELVVLVTATLVEPLSVVAERPLPGMLHEPPSDWELYVEGKLEGDVLPKVAPADAAWLRERGLDRLQGPGAWSDYNQPPARPRRELRPRQSEESRFNDDSAAEPSQPATQNQAAGDAVVEDAGGSSNQAPAADAPERDASQDEPEATFDFQSATDAMSDPEPEPLNTGEAMQEQPAAAPEEGAEPTQDELEAQSLEEAADALAAIAPWRLRF